MINDGQYSVNWLTIMIVPGLSDEIVCMTKNIRSHCNEKSDNFYNMNHILAPFATITTRSTNSRVSNSRQEIMLSIYSLEKIDKRLNVFYTVWYPASRILFHVFQRIERLSVCQTMDLVVPCL